MVNLSEVYITIWQLYEMKLLMSLFFISIALVLNLGPYVPAGTNRLGEWVLNLHNAGYIFQKWVGNYSKSLTV